MRISQVLTNLIGNAMKFTEQGEVRLCVRTEERARPHGPGAASPSRTPASASRRTSSSSVFESFTQADTSTTRKYGGAGLGLAICQELVSLMGGTLSARSAEGVGSTFSFTLPARGRRRTSAE